MGKHQTVFKNAINPKNIPLYFEGMLNDFGLKFSIMLMSNYFFIKGAINTFAASVQLPYWEGGGWSNLDYGIAMPTANIPWSIKAFPGILTDVFPIFGFEKSSYMMIYTVLGTTSILILGSIPMSKETINIAFPTLLFFCINMQTANTDLLLEGKYVDLMKKNPNNKGNVLSFTYFFVTLGSIIPAASVGIMSDTMEARFQFFLYLPFAAQGIVFIAMGCIVNDKAAPHRNNRIDFNKIKHQAPLMTMALMMGIVGAGTVVVSIFFGTTVQFLYNLLGGFFLGVLMWFTLPRGIAKILYYVYVAMFSYLSLDTHLEYFYTHDCVENGPNFSYVYFKTWVGFVGIAASFVGIWLFQAVLCQYKYRVIFWSSSILRAVASIFDIIMINRWNVAIGIPDEYMYMLGSTIIYKICYQMDYMPIALMCAKVCPRNVETAMFSIAAGYGNYGAAVSAYVGNYVIDFAGVKIGDNIECNHDNLAIIVFVGHCIMPLLSIPLTFLLIPNKYVSDHFSDPTFKDAGKYYEHDDKSPTQHQSQEVF